MRHLGILTLIMLSACSGSSIAEATDGSSLIDTEAGRYQVDIDPKLDTKTLPMNADLKMVDGDIMQYAIGLCGLDFANKLAPSRCEVFVQPDKTGFIVGYIVLQQAKDTRIDTALETDRQRGGIGCFLSGILENSDYQNLGSKLDISKNFQARLPFFAWEKSPGNWMVSSEDSDEYSAGGMWYVKRSNNKLRVNQERWNYCYSDDKVYIDEVFLHAATLTRAAN